MKDLRHHFKHAGYNAEELYFEKVNQELIFKMRVNKANTKRKGGYLRLVVDNTGAKSQNRGVLLLEHSSSKAKKSA